MARERLNGNPDVCCRFIWKGRKPNRAAGLPGLAPSGGSRNRERLTWWQRFCGEQDAPAERVSCSPAGRYGYSRPCRMPGRPRSGSASGLDSGKKTGHVVRLASGWRRPETRGAPRHFALSKGKCHFRKLAGPVDGYPGAIRNFFLAYGRGRRSGNRFWGSFQKKFSGTEKSG